MMNETSDRQQAAKGKFERGMIEYSHQQAKDDSGVTKKKEKVERFLTVQGLLNHPYFMSINEADIAIIIDEFEKFT